ncbi:MAG TPA: TldD/PmbA family protein [Gemmatimonadaceae bacterium]|jgi:Predicted Zn-dependent proteases and their inactivated homologs
MSVTRRVFLQRTGAAAVITAAAAAVPRPLLAQLGREPEPVPPVEDPRLRALTARALESARSAGARYADVRLTHTRTREFWARFVHDEEALTVGVRALVDGYWGFASSPVWSPDEMARLGREAVHHAKVSAVGRPRTVELAPAPVVEDGHWTMPVELDPFALSPFEMEDFLRGLEIYAGRITSGGVRVGIQLNNATGVVQEKVFASTDGSYYTQRTYHTGGVFAGRVRLVESGIDSPFSLDCLSFAGLGWELYAAERVPQVRDQPLREVIRQRVEETRETMLMPVKPVEVGRYDAVLDAWSMAQLIDHTLGRATELDRALGYEANAGGTSYLNDPFAMLGTYEAGAPLLTVTGNRSDPGAVATVQWDDEGVRPDAFPLVKDGVLTDFQTTRESAGWLEELYAKTGRPFRSHGCANAPAAVDAPLQHTPNLVLASGREALDFDALVAGMSEGIAVKRVGLDMDFQNSSGLGTGEVYEIKRGKRVARIASAGFLFRATELWKGLLDLGGAASVLRYGVSGSKGEPAQHCLHSVSAPPAAMKQLTLIDPLRKA